MVLNEVLISKAIISGFTEELTDYLDIDVAIAGAGPAGLIAAYYLAKEGKKVAIFERRLSIGGGMWTGGMMFNRIVIQKEAKYILEEFGIRLTKFEDEYYTTDSVETVSGICYKAINAGAKIFNMITAEDLVIKDDKVSGFVINWSTTDMNHLLIDPLTIHAKICVDATGHDANIVNKLVKKNNVKIRTETGTLIGEKGMNADLAEKLVVENTGEVFPGLYVAGMACAATFGSPRMGPIFGGMFLSGKKLAEMIIKKLN